MVETTSPRRDSDFLVDIIENPLEQVLDPNRWQMRIHPALQESFERLLMVDPTMATRFFEIGATLEADFPQYTAQSSKQDGGEPQAWPDELVLGVILYATQLAILPWIDDKSQCLVNMPEIVYQAHLAEIQARTFSEPSGDPDVMDVVANLITEYHALHTSHLFDPFYFDRLDGTREELAQIMLGLRRLRGDEAYWHEIRIPDNYQDYLAWAAKSSPQAEPKPEVAYAYSGGDIARLARRWGPVVGVVGAVAFLVACGGDSESAIVVETPVQESGGLIGDVTVEVVPTVTVEDLAAATVPTEASPTLPATAEPEANATPTAETVNIGGGYTLEDLTAEQITSANEWLALLFEAGVISSTGEWNLVPHESGIFCIEGPAIDVADQPGEGQISDTLIVQDSELAVGYRIDRANEFVLAGISDAQALTISADGMTLALNGAGEIVGMRLSYRQAGTGITTAELVPYFEAVAFEHDGESWLAYDSEGNVLASFDAGNGVWVEAAEVLSPQEQWEVDMREVLDASGMEVSCSYVGTKQQNIPEDVPHPEKICYMYGNSRGDMQVLSPENEKLGTARLLATHINHVLGRIDGQDLPEGWEDTMARYRNADGTVKSVDEIVEQAIADGFSLNLPRIEKDANGNYVVGILEGASFLNTHFEIGYDYVDGSRADNPELDDRGIFSAAYSSGGFYLDGRGRLVLVMENYISPNDSLISSRTAYSSITNYSIRAGEVVASAGIGDYGVSYMIEWIGGNSEPWKEVLADFHKSNLFDTVRADEWVALQAVSGGEVVPTPAGSSQ